MIRLPTTHAAITAPLVASATAWPGIPIGRSLLDGRPFHLSPALTDASVLPSTNSLAMGGMGSGKSTTAKTRIRREILDHGHQAVVIDCFGEDASGEWAPLTRSLSGRVIDAGDFTLNPCSELFPRQVREQLIRSLIAAVEPDALTPQATHALQHALNHPKAASLSGLVDALVEPEDGRWPAATLTDWGVGTAIALSRYTEGSLQGLFDGQSAALPPADLPILSFDFSRLDRNSPAIPSLMAAISCWVEHVWLRQSTAPHRHLVLEEAWQILLSPATAELIQRLLKNSRKAGLSLDAVMHTLSDLGTGAAQDLARLCEIAHVGRLGPEEAAAVGALLGLPAWAVDEIPRLAPGQAVWKVGPHYVDIIETVLSDEELRLTDTSRRRRQAQAQQTLDTDPEATEAFESVPEAAETTDDQDDDELVAPADQDANDWNWEMPSNVIDARPRDDRHHAVLQAAHEGRFSEAAQLAAIGEREDITAYGINSDEAVTWLSTQARVADLAGNPDRAAHLRATVTRMGKDDVQWYEKYSEHPPVSSEQAPLRPPAPAPEPTSGPSSSRRHTRRYVAAIAAAAIAVLCVWQNTHDEQQTRESKEKAAHYQGISGGAVTIDGVKAQVVAHWSTVQNRVVLQLRSYFDPNARYLRIDSSGKSASSRREAGWYPDDPKIVLPVNDFTADVTVRIAVGGRNWKEGSRAVSRSIRLSPTGAAYDADTGARLPSDL